MTKNVKNSLRLKKIGALIGIIVLVLSSFTVFCFAADSPVYQTISPISFNNFSDFSAFASFSQSDQIELSSAINGVQVVNRTYINNNDYYYNNSSNLMTKTYNGETVTYFTISIRCQYSAVYVNSVVYNQTSATVNNHATISGAFQFECFPVESSLISGYTSYSFDIIVSEQTAIDQARQEGYDQGYSEGYSSGYSNGSVTGSEQARQEGYDQGYADGRDSTDSENLGQNLLGDTLNAPMNALNGFILYESSSGFQVTLGLVVGAVISLTLFIALLKIFAGG